MKRGCAIFIACLLLGVWGCAPAANTVRSAPPLKPESNSDSANSNDNSKSSSPDQSSPQYRFTNGSGATNIPFEINANKIYLRVNVNDAGPFSFLLDSGAAFDVLDNKQAEMLALKLNDASQVKGAGEGFVNIATGTGVTLRLPGLDYFKQSITVLPINSSISRNEGRSVNGLLGYDFFKRFVVEINYAEQRLNVYEPQSYKYDGPGEVIPLAEDHEHTFINAMLVLPNGNRARSRLLVDTGARMALTLNTPFVEAHHLLAVTPAKIASTIGIGVGGEYRAVIARVESLQFGRFRIKAPVAVFSRAESGVLAGSDYDGIIGAEILRRFKVIINYSAHQMIVEPNAFLNEQYEFDMSGLNLIAEGADFKTYKIYRVIEPSPAASAGLRQGDLVEAINGQPAANFTLEQIRQMFTKGEGVEYKLSVGRDKKSLNVNFKLRRLI